MNFPVNRISEIIHTAEKMLTAQGNHDAAKILKAATYNVQKTDHDNWNGGTDIWEISLFIDATEYVHLEERREIIQNSINETLKPILNQYKNDWCSVVILPRVEMSSVNFRAEDEVSEVTRRKIFNEIQNVSWSGCLDEVEFLKRIYDLKHMASSDSRFTNAEGDIWQHCINNPNDWKNGWIFSDSRFELLNGSTDLFFRFLCAMVEPEVRPNKQEADNLVQIFNRALKEEGWGLFEAKKIAGHSRFEAQRLHLGASRSVSRARKVADVLDASWMKKEIERLEKAIENDPALAIGTAKEIVETCCKHILSKREVKFLPSDNLPALTKLLLKELKLVPEGISDHAKGAEIIRQLLNNLSVITKYLAELRGLYGSGHGREGNHRGLEARHARLAAGAAIAFIEFVVETYHQQEAKK